MKMTFRVLLFSSALAVALALPAAAEIGISGSASFASEYILRGISLSNEEPAVQASIEFSAGGFYLGGWGSNVEFGPGTNSQVELDVYLGYAWEWDSFSLDLGVIHYEYAGTTPDFSYQEYYLGLGFKGFTLYYWYADDFLGSGSEGGYFDAAWKGGIGGGFNLGLHAGYNTFDDNLAVGLLDYYDYKVSLDRNFSKLNVEVGYTDTDENQLGNLDDARAYLLLTVSSE